MPVQQEIKSQLARLLATEDLVVEHKNVETAQFNVHTRVLTLPLWKCTGDVYDMLVGHEVAHALFTPDEDWTEKVQIPQQFVNVCEDVRIEKKMKRKYLGIAKTFYRGYNELNDKDFFEIEDEDIDKFNLADRINLHYKIGSFIDVSFSDVEKEIVDLVGAAETFDEMLDASKILYEYCKKQQEQEEKINLENQPEQKGKLDFELPSPSTEDGEDGEQEESEGDSQQSPQMEESGNAETQQEAGDSFEPEVRTADSLEEKLQDFIDRGGVDSVYVEVPKLYLNEVIISNEDIHKEINSSFAEQEKELNDRIHQHDPHWDCFLEVDSRFLEFKKSAQKEVSYLVKEFECRKAADNYARANTSRTGVLDTTKLHTYRFNEDIFKRITTVPDGKNHGLVFILDWSGSMAHVMLDTIKQLYNLLWFCKKVNIPFEVYAFSNEWHRTSYYGSNDDVKENYEAKEYDLHVEKTFALLNLLTSKVNAKTFDSQLLNIWRVISAFQRDYYSVYTYPHKLSLSGTPLNESLIALHQILPKFQKENQVQKVQCVVLTDGEANHLAYRKTVNRSFRYLDGEDEDYLGCRNLNPHTSFLRDRKCGKVYKFGYGYHTFTDALLTNLKDKFPTVNFIGMRLLPNRDAMRFAKLYHGEYDKEYNIIQKDWKKQKSFIIKNSGYDAYFGLSASNLADDAEFEVQEDATKAQIKRAFAKSLKVKKLNKKVLGEFVSLVA
tara:strand:- start:140 stop:2305 length:2166 start_codon:yes stop_codon:yes gene_type:complete